MDENLNYGDYSVANALKNMKYDLKQDIFNNVSPPSSKYLPTLRVAITMWQSELRNTELTSLNISPQINNFKQKLQKSVPGLKIPNICETTLKEIISAVGDELENFLIDNVCNFATCDEFKLCLNNICWTQQGTINTVKTITNFIENINLRNCVKFELACNYCLEQKILNFLQVYDEPIFNEEVFQENIYKFVMIRYWILHINENLDMLSSITNGIPTWRYLLTWAITYKKEATVQYICEKLSRETLREHILEFVVHIATWEHGFKHQLSSMKILFYFLTKMNEIQIKEASVYFHLYIIRMTHRISRWRNNGLDVSNYVLELIAKNNFTISFDSIRILCSAKIINTGRFVTIWNSFTTRFRYVIKNCFLLFCEYLFDPKKFMKSDIFIGQLVLRLGALENIRIVIYNDRTMRCFLRMIKESPDYVDDFFNIMLKTEEISRFKMEILENENLGLWEDLAWSGQYEMMNNLLNRFCPGDNIDELKRELPYRRNAHIILFILRNSNAFYVNQLESMIKFLTWCFNGNLKGVTRCIKTIFDIETNLFQDVKEQCFRIFKELVREEKWDLVQRYTNFIFNVLGMKMSTSMNNFKRFKKLVYLMYGERNITYGLNKQQLLADNISRGVNESLNLRLLNLNVNGIETLILSVESSFLIKLGKRITLDNLESLLQWFKFYFGPNNLLKNDFLSINKSNERALQLGEFRLCALNEENAPSIIINVNDSVHLIFQQRC